MTVVATAGHVDHGKSSLVLALTGTDPDRLAEEQRRGLTIDLGFAHAEVGGEAVSFVDVPGHVRFLRNMLAGVGGIDACLFVVAAPEGWKPQSEEHLRILQLLGARDGVVALTKVDVLDDDDDLVQIAALEVADHVAGTFLEGAPIVPVAAPRGVGVAELAAAVGDLVRRTPPAGDRGRARLWVDRVFVVRGSGTVVTGTLTDGPVAVDDHVVVEPGRRPAHVRGIQTAGADVERISPGSRVALNLAGIDHAAIGRGDAVVAPGRWTRTRRFDAALTVLASLDHAVSRRGAYLAYIGSGEHAVRVRVLGADAVEPGVTAPVRLHLDVDLPLLPGDRFVLRETGRDETVGGGEVLDVSPVLPASRARPDRRVERVIDERGWVDVGELELMTGERRPATIGRWVVADGALAESRAAVDALVDGAGPLGVEVAALDERQRAVLLAMEGVEVDGGRARRRGAADALADHPVLAALAAGGMAPDAPTGIDRAGLRELERRGSLVERDGVWFHLTAITAAADLAARLLEEDAAGFTVSRFRDTAGISRRHAMPLLGELDARGVTRRRGDVRIAGPRLPPPRSVV